MTRSSYRREASALDAEILQCIETRYVPDFNGLALRVFVHQLRYNKPYARYCAAMGITPERLPADWEAIPPVPSGAFKEAALTTFDPITAALKFHTSGTTQGTSGVHYMETSALYDAALAAGFGDAMLVGRVQPMRYLLLVPNPDDRPDSSLGYMMRRVAAHYGDGKERWFLRGDMLDVDGFVEAAGAAAAEKQPVCVAGTAFAFVQLIDALRRVTPLPEGSRVMETGGFKGRSRFVGRDELYASIAQLFAIDDSAIVAEYGMTELTSQYYDRPNSRVKASPPWLRARVVGNDGRTLPAGQVGALVHVDLANRSSCIAIQTEDLGTATGDGGLLLIGREEGADLRGCSLDAEQLRVLQAK